MAAFASLLRPFVVRLNHRASSKSSLTEPVGTVFSGSEHAAVQLGPVSVARASAVSSNGSKHQQRNA